MLLTDWCFLVVWVQPQRNHRSPPWPPGSHQRLALVPPAMSSRTWSLGPRCFQWISVTQMLMCFRPHHKMNSEQRPPGWRASCPFIVEEQHRSCFGADAFKQPKHTTKLVEDQEIARNHTWRGLSPTFTSCLVQKFDMQRPRPIWHVLHSHEPCSINLKTTATELVFSAQNSHWRFYVRQTVDSLINLDSGSFSKWSKTEPLEYFHFCFHACLETIPESECSVFSQQFDRNRHKYCTTARSQTIHIQI